MYLTQSNREFATFLLHFVRVVHRVLVHLYTQDTVPLLVRTSHHDKIELPSSISFGDSYYYYYYYYYFLAHQHKACRQLKIKQEMTAVGD